MSDELGDDILGVRDAAFAKTEEEVKKFNDSGYIPVYPEFWLDPVEKTTHTLWRKK